MGISADVAAVILVYEYRKQYLEFQVKLKEKFRMVVLSACPRGRPNSAKLTMGTPVFVVKSFESANAQDKECSSDKLPTSSN
jgi:hypothetical protein